VLARQVSLLYLIEPAHIWLKPAPPLYVTLEVACDCSACARACCSVRSCQNRPLSCDPLPRPRHRQALAHKNILCTEGLPSHPFRTCRTLRSLRTSRPSFQEGDTQAWALPHWCTERWLWSTTQTRRWRMRRTAARRKAALTAHHQRSEEFQTRPPVSHLYPSRSAIYTHPLCAQARKTIHRCTAVANE